MSANRLPLGATAILTHGKLFSRLFGNSCDKLCIRTIYKHDNSFSSYCIVYMHVYAMLPYQPDGHPDIRAIHGKNLVEKS